MTEVPGDPSPRPPALRIGDDERDRAVELLHLALTKGQLDYAEFDERARTARAATYRHELAPLTADLVDPDALPSPAGPASPAAAMVTGEPGGNAFSIACMSGTELTGDWYIARTHWSLAVMGGNVLDLTDARLTSPHTMVTAAAVMGGVEIHVPEDIRVQASGLPVMGGFIVTDGDGVTLRQSDLPADAPSITVRGLALMGGVTVVRTPRTRPPHRPEPPQLPRRS